jgi:hypothetical protein
MTMAVFLGGAKSRLLPASVPFRFFAAAAIFHVLVWAAMLGHAGEITSFRGGLGPALTTVHLLTLGVLTMAAAGASVQLLPVATRRSLAAVWPIKLLFWLLVPGVLLLSAGMHEAYWTALTAGAALVTGALIVLAVLLADNLRRAGSMPIVSAYGWTSLASLTALVVMGLLLIADYERAIFQDHAAAALAHMILAGFGFMGLLAIGFSHILIPMFSLSSAPRQTPAFATFALAASALLAGTAGALAASDFVLTLASLGGLAAAGLHIFQMQQVLASGMRKRLGLSFILVRAAWTMLPLTIFAGIAALYGVSGQNGATLFGFLLLFGWLLTFLLGILQRIVPFLASMHATRGDGRSPPPLSELSASWPLKLHAGCHLGALALLAPAILLDNVLLARIGAVSGLIAAFAFAWFVADVFWRVLRPRGVS